MFVRGTRVQSDLCSYSRSNFPLPTETTNTVRYCDTSTWSHNLPDTTSLCIKPVCGLQQFLDDDLEGRGQAVGAGLLLVLCSICGLIRCFSQRGEGLTGETKTTFQVLFVLTEQQVLYIREKTPTDRLVLSS